MLYIGNNDKQFNDASRIRQAFKDRFGSQLGPDCSTQYHNDYNCFLEITRVPVGPFTVSEWSIFVLPEFLLPMMQWATQYREQYTIFIHPNSGCQVEDHSDWAMFNGPAYPLDLSYLDPDRPFPW